MAGGQNDLLRAACSVVEPGQGNTLRPVEATSIPAKLDAFVREYRRGSLLIRTANCPEAEAFDPATGERVAGYARRIIGEALTQTSRALEQATVLRDLLGGQEGEKRFLLNLLERHRARLDRLGIERLEAEPAD